MRVPDPLGMRWFGVIGLISLIGVALELTLPAPMGGLVYLMLFAASSLALIALSEVSKEARRWLLGRWL